MVDSEDDASISSIGSIEDVFSDIDHLRSSLRQFDPTLIVQKIRKDLDEVLPSAEEAHEEEDALLADAMAQLQQATDTGDTSQRTIHSKGRRPASLLKSTLEKNFIFGRRRTFRLESPGRN